MKLDAVTKVHVVLGHSWFLQMIKLDFTLKMEAGRFSKTYHTTSLHGITTQKTMTW